MRVARNTRRTSMTQPLIDKENRSPPSHAESASPPSSKKARHRLSTVELARLEDVFKRDTHPSRQEKKGLAAELGMDYKTVTIWFQNKRQTSKRGQPPTEQSDQSAGRIKADSCLRAVSSPSHNATLDMSGTDPDLVADSPDSKGSVGLNGTTAKAIVKLKPLFDSLNALTSMSRGHAECTETRDEAPNVEDSEPHQLQTSPDDSIATPEPAGREHVTEPEQTKKSIRWKRTLEWACERQARRRKLSKGAYVRLGSEEVEDHADPNDTRVDSALSLLSLASSAQVGPPKDVMKGASLLLSFRHSWRRK